MADAELAGQGVAFKAAAIARAPTLDVHLPDSLLDDIVDLLGVTDEKWVAALRRMLPLQARAYLHVKAIVGTYNAHRSRKAVARLSSALTEALEAMDDIGIEQTLALTVLLERTERPPAPESMIQVRQVIEAVRDVATDWVEKYRPRDRRPRNRALEQHVGALMCLFEQVTGTIFSAPPGGSSSHCMRMMRI